MEMVGNNLVYSKVCTPEGYSLLRLQADSHRLQNLVLVALQMKHNINKTLSRALYHARRWCLATFHWLILYDKVVPVTWQSMEEVAFHFNLR